MVDGYLIAGDAYDRATGRPTRAIIRGVLCSTQDRRLGGDGGTSKPSVIPAIRSHTGVWQLIYRKAEYVWREDAPT